MSNYRTGPTAPPPFVYTARLPRSWVVMNVLGGLVPGLFLFWLGSRSVDISCTRSPAHVVSCASTVRSLTSTKTRVVPIPADGQASVEQRVAGRSRTSAVIVKSPTAGVVALTPFSDMAGADNARIAEQLNALLQDRKQTSMHVTSNGIPFLAGMGLFLVLAGIGCAFFIHRWRSTIRVVRGPSPRIEFERFRWPLARILRPIAVGPNAMIETEPAPRPGLVFLTVRRQDGTTERISAGKANSPKVAGLVRDLNEALRPI